MLIDLNEVVSMAHMKQIYRRYMGQYDEATCTLANVGNEKGNNPMYEKFKATSTQTATVVNMPAPTDTVEEQRKYLGRRALNVLGAKYYELDSKFKITFDYHPATVQEAAQRLKDGAYTMEGADKVDPIKYPWGGLQAVFSWRGPDDQPDELGYKAARTEFDAFASPLLDEIRIFDPKDGLESLRKLEAWEPTAPTVH